MKLSLIRNLFVFVGVVALLTSCDPDIIDPPSQSDPNVTVSNPPSGEIDAGSTFTISVTATPTAENTLKSVAITEDGSNIPFDRLTIDGVAASANPILLFGDDQNGFTWSIDIVSHADAGVKQYEVEVTDDGNNVGEFGFDVTTAINVVNPSLTIDGNMSTMVPAGTLFKLNATLTMETFDLASMTFYQGTETIDKSRIEFAGVDIDDNPYMLPSDFADGGEAEIFLRVQESAGTETYRFVLTDVEGNSGDYSFDIVTGTPPETLEGVLFNSAGPTGTGGLDLDTGEGVGSSDAAAELRDEGIDTDEPNATNWIQRISGVNGAEVKALVPGEGNLLESFTFEGITSKESIASLWDNGITFADTNSSGTPISDVVEVGDMFTVKSGDNYYVVLVKEVNLITSGEPTDLNKDNYVVDIKK